MSEAFHHEHLVRINDPANVSGDWLTREQLWAGLRHTIESPQALDESIDAAVVREIMPGTLAREIRRGSTSSRDEVHLVHNVSMEICADARGAFAGSKLTIRIEEPAPEMLFVRFTYELHGLDEAREEEEDAARRSAYKFSDIDRIREVRRYAARRRH